MYLERTLRENPGLIRTAFELHRAGAIPPNCFVLDVDAIGANAALLSARANELGIGLYFMSKQIGHNPVAVDAIRRAGIDAAVAVDMRSAVALHAQGATIGNVGHLAQIPSAQTDQALALDPEVVTVFSADRAAEVSRAAERRGRSAALLLRIWEPGAETFPGQEGGITLDELAGVVDQVAALPRVRIAGVTAFPCIEYAEDVHAYRPTRNLAAIVSAADVLRARLGLDDLQVNAPGASCLSTLPLAVSMGATHVEPGHALTGTNPHHAFGEGEELPAVVYVSEIVQTWDDRATAFGGGLYRRGRLRHALAGPSAAAADDLPLHVELPSPSNIDYYFTLSGPAVARLEPGDTVVCALRPQIFVSYSLVAAVTGIRSDSPALAGLFGSDGSPYTGWRTS